MSVDPTTIAHWQTRLEAWHSHIETMYEHASDQHHNTLAFALSRLEGELSSVLETFDDARITAQEQHRGRVA